MGMKASFTAGSWKLADAYKIIEQVANIYAREWWLECYLSWKTMINHVPFLVCAEDSPEFRKISARMVQYFLSTSTRHIICLSGTGLELQEISQKHGIFPTTEILKSLTIIMKDY